MSTDLPQLSQSDVLARIFLDVLAGRPGCSNRRVSEPDEADSELCFEVSLAKSSVRPDAAAIAVLLARAIEKEPGLTEKLRSEAPIVTIQTHSGDQVDLVKEILVGCALPEGARTFDQSSSFRTRGPQRGALVIARKGKAKDETPESDNDCVTASIHLLLPIIGISPEPARHLPRSLFRAAEHRLQLGKLDSAAVSLVIEAVIGAPAEHPIDPELARVLDVEDLVLAVRPGRDSAQCITSLEELVRVRRETSIKGPVLEELDGYGDAKRWGLDLVADLADYNAGRIEWSDVANKALLLSGAPGLGKTMFASALAKSAGVPLIATSVAEWNEAPYLSGTLQAISRAFQKARQQAPSILFIDELDGISNRSGLGGEYAEYWLQIVNRLLELLSSIEGRVGVVVIGATNHPERIDSALRRSGRLDREIILRKPDSASLARIFRHHLGPDRLPNVDLERLAASARGYSGADVEAVVRRASATARRGRRALSLGDLLAEIGGIDDLSTTDRRRIALHEVGHAIVAHDLNAGSMTGCSIGSGGGSFDYRSDLTGSATLARVGDELAMWMAGTAAERLVLGESSLGSGMAPNSDLAAATKLACAFELRSGLGHIGRLYVDSADLLSTPSLANAVRMHLDRAETRAFEVLKRRGGALQQLAAQLSTEGFLSAEAVAACLQERDGPDLIAV